MDHWLSTRAVIIVAWLAASLSGCGGSTSPAAPSTTSQVAALPVTETFTSSVSNPGTTPIQRTLSLTQTQPAERATVTCMASGGAVCPPADALTGANLFGGGIGYTVSPGGTLNFTITLTHS